MGNKIIEGLSAITTSLKEVTPDIQVLQFTIVNAFLIGTPGHSVNDWVLVDTGLENSADFILKSAEKRFGQGSRPKAIVLTHGHFDHVGSVLKLSSEWDVSVYAHELEIPYITGNKDYPLADPTVSNGLVAKMSPTFPHTSINLGFRAVALPTDGTIPGMPGWKWIHTPGHTEGHVSLFREKDRVLLPADAFTTVKQESLMSVLTQNEQISGPPSYLTTDWKKAESSVKRLMDLQPSLVIPSHGQPMKGEDLKRHLHILVRNFDEIAVPEQGRFLDRQ
ncbi:MBL fold metallo-hydrolase [Desulforamulus ruminis]|uniref:Beta-lactamase domain protein n=1 Tax=Desulforamulus ruminis (strain ATCC 23193 / DSM 2154 / NCIMB 8452 / DL) TaxID=696281 RepID=F6DP25_DESRL|nr:MBL fold metallo-hydrolase [Desulforamulus ruminis]AEG60744.1 beta-lactamase domain protein [Desulforamulus ruminis DSM 2154]